MRMSSNNKAAYDKWRNNEKLYHILPDAFMAGVVHGRQELAQQLKASIGRIMFKLKLPKEFYK